MFKSKSILSAFLSGVFMCGACQAEIINISTRGLAGSGDRTMIAGFTINGTESLKVAIVAGGPTLANYGVTNVVADPRLTVFNAAGENIGSNDSWNNNAEIAPLSIAPTDDAEAGIVLTLSPGKYTVHVEGAGSGLGNAIVAVENIDSSSSSTLTNISTRSIIGNGDERMIVGFVLEGAEQSLTAMAIGPTLSGFGVSDTLSDPLLNMYDSGGTLLAENDDWRTGNDAGNIDDITSYSEIQPNDMEAAVIRSLPAGSYTIVVEGNNSGTGNGLVSLDDYEVWSQPTPSPATAFGTLAVTGTNSDLLNEHSFAPDNFETLGNGDLKWLIGDGSSGWALILQFMPNSTTEVLSVTFSNGWTTEQVADYVSFTPVEGVTVNASSVVFDNVSGSDRLTLDGTLSY